MARPFTPVGPVPGTRGYVQNIFKIFEKGKTKAPKEKNSKKERKIFTLPFPCILYEYIALYYSLNYCFANS